MHWGKTHSGQILISLASTVMVVAMGAFGPDISIVAGSGVVACGPPALPQCSEGGFTVVLTMPGFFPLILARTVLAATLASGAPFLTSWRRLKVALARKVWH